MRIAVIHHALDQKRRIGKYLIADFCRAFEAAGHRVVHLRGPERVEPADIALLHVNASVVPADHVAIAGRYPAALNMTVTDIRKSVVSQARLGDDQGYDGPVIVKSDLNHGGVPERTRLPRQRPEERPPSHMAAHRGSLLNYQIFDTPADVPPKLRTDPDRVVERFLPEREGDFYFVRQSFFLGDRCVTWRLGARSPIVRGTDFEKEDMIPTPPAISAYRSRLGLDYGKIDYVEHDGIQTVFDVNKTIGGAGTAPDTVALLAPGITSPPLRQDR